MKPYCCNKNMYILLLRNLYYTYSRVNKNRYHVLYFILTTSYNDLFHYDLVGQLRGAYYPFMAWSDIICVWAFEPCKFETAQVIIFRRYPKRFYK